MAKRNQKTVNETQCSLKETEIKVTKNQTVRFKEMWRSEYGAFDEGDFAELPALLASELVIAEVVEYANKPEEKESEDYI